MDEIVWFRRSSSSKSFITNMCHRYCAWIPASFSYTRQTCSELSRSTIPDDAPGPTTNMFGQKLDLCIKSNKLVGNSPIKSHQQGQLNLLQTILLQAPPLSSRIQHHIVSIHRCSHTSHIPSLWLKISQKHSLQTGTGFSDGMVKLAKVWEIYMESEKL
jgi:hypothetical protein